MFKKYYLKIRGYKVTNNKPKNFALLHSQYKNYTLPAPNLRKPPDTTVAKQERGVETTRYCYTCRVPKRK